MSKILYVASEVQAVLMSQVFIPELTDGTTFGPRPAGHGEVWRDVEVKVTTDGTLGPVGFTPARNYNFLNPAFSVPHADMMVDMAKSVKETATIGYVKKELTDLSRIVGGRMPHVSATPVKLFRGNHKEGTVTVSSAKARAAGKELAEAASKPVKPAAKKAPTTAKKAPTTAKKAGTTTKRVAVA